jgi:hypothetical protein
MKAHGPLCADLKRLLDSRELADVVIMVGTAEHPVHRAILAARSPRLLAACLPVPPTEAGTKAPPAPEPAGAKEPTRLALALQPPQDLPVGERCGQPAWLCAQPAWLCGIPSACLMTWGPYPLRVFLGTWKSNRDVLTILDAFSRVHRRHQRPCRTSKSCSTRSTRAIKPSEAHSAEAWLLVWCWAGE